MSYLQRAFSSRYDLLAAATRFDDMEDIDRCHVCTFPLLLLSVHR